MMGKIKYKNMFFKLDDQMEIILTLNIKTLKMSFSDHQKDIKIKDLEYDLIFKINKAKHLNF